ncbi:MAG: oligosaccharide flippase family protein [Candidatus Lernaella stagnicola]|nr:oligosaccharide flippase family protein [Candidatus Lernaella stagnicola]
MNPAPTETTGPPRLGERAAGAMYWNLLGKFALMLLRFLESVVLIRLLGDALYGSFAVALTINNIAVLAAALGLENTLLRFVPQALMQEGARGERRLVRQALLTRLVLSLAVAAGIWWAAPWLAEVLLKDPARDIWVRLAAFMLVGLGLQNLLARVLVARYEQKFINFVQASLTALYLVAATIAVKLGGGPASVLACLVVLYGATAALFLWRWRRENPIAREPVEPGEPPSIWRVIRFSGFSYVYNVLHFVLQKPMDVLLLTLLLDQPAQIAFYVIAYNFVFQSVSFFGNAFSEGVSLAMISEVAAAGDYDKLRRIFAVSMEYLYLFVIPIFIGGLIIGADILHVLYPESTANGAFGPMIVLLFALSFAKMGSLTANFLQGMDKEKALVQARLVFGAVNFILDLILIWQYGALGAAIATSIAVVAGIGYEWRIVHRALQPVYPWRFLSKIAAAGVGMGGLLFWLRGALPWPLWGKVPALLIAGIVAFTLLLLVLRPFRPDHADLLASLPLPGKKWLLRWFVSRKKPASPTS